MVISYSHYFTIKKRVYQEVKRAIASGLLADPRLCKCADCGGKAVCYDHHDYDKPLKVVAVCRLCNWRRGPAKQGRYVRHWTRRGWRIGFDLCKKQP